MHHSARRQAPTKVTCFAKNGAAGQTGGAQQQRHGLMRRVASCAAAVALSLSVAGHASCREEDARALLQRPEQTQKVGLFEFGSGITRDPIEPFTLYGDIVKKFFIENLDETGKILSRRKGFTTTVCINAVEQVRHSCANVFFPPLLPSLQKPLSPHEQSRRRSRD